MNTITNPILKGFNPDPSILRVDDDYYIATPTFEWWPGVQIHHSKDLVNWQVVAHPLNRVSQLDMNGIQASRGIWAPCLSYDNGIFYLVYTNVKSFGGAFKDTHNYLVTTTDILSDWSEPVHLNSIGFDPSLFHDDDGKKYMLGMISDHRQNRNEFGGIFIQEYDAREKRLLGKHKKIFGSTERGLTEGPHLYKRNGFNYLILAEGGTSVDHSVAMARSKNIDGPYELDPKGSVLTASENRDLLI